MTRRTVTRPGALPADLDVERVTTDLARRGWSIEELAVRADVSSMTVRNFLSGRSRTAKTARAFARAFGYSPRRYLRRAVSA